MVLTVFGPKAFSLYSFKENGEGHYESVIKKGLFDVLMNGFTVYDQHQVLPVKDALKEELLWLMSNSEFIDVITGAGTDGKKKLETKFDIWLSSLNEIIGRPESEPRFFTWEFKNKLLKSNPVCEICSQRIERVDNSEIDHIEFYWRGGKAIPENARLVHRFCKRSRKRKDGAIKRIPTISLNNIDSVNELEKKIRDRVHSLLLNRNANYWDVSIPEQLRTQIAEMIKGEISRRPYEKDSFNTPYSKLQFCGIRDFRKIIINNWSVFEKYF